MLTNDEPEATRTLAPEMPLLMAAELQDHLMTATHDLERLQRLLDDACGALMDGFHGAAHQLGHVLDEGGQALPEGLHQTLQTLYRAVTALQFQDMASQLIVHTSRRLRCCAEQIARDAMGEDPEGEAVVEDIPLRPNPVTQDEMDAGSVELF